MARDHGARAGADAQGTARGDPVAIPGASRRDRVGAMSPAPLVEGGFLRDGAILLGAALFFVMLFRRLGLGATLGYIVAGALIGPSVLGLFREPEAIQRVSEIGIALLLFIVGLELRPSRLWRLRTDIFGGLAQVTLCGVAIAAI